MPISKLYNKRVATQRLSAVSGSRKETWQTNLAVLACAIHPLESNETILNGGIFRGFKLFCASGADLAIGDRVIDGSSTYTVKGLSDFDFGRNQHIEAVLELGR